MPENSGNRIDEELNRIDVEAPADTQATHAYESESAAAGTAAAGISAENEPTARGRMADRVDRVGDVLERRALELELKGGIKAKAAPAMRRAGRVADVGAAYVRDNDIADMRGDLEDSIREHPLRSMAIAIGAGYLLARLLD